MSPVTAWCGPGRHAAGHPTGTFSDGAALPPGWAMVRMSQGRRNPASPAASPCCPLHLPSWPEGTVPGHGLEEVWQPGWYPADRRAGQKRSPGDWLCQCGQRGTGGTAGHAAHAARPTRCRHCGCFLEWMPGGFWAGPDGFTACVKAPLETAATGAAAAFVIHLPMPDLDATGSATGGS